MCIKRIPTLSGGGKGNLSGVSIMPGPEQAVKTGWPISFLEIETKTRGVTWDLCLVRKPL